jgi:hypothetical protein
LLRRGKLKPPPKPTMALMNVDQVPPTKPVEKTPDVLVTPCDPWPAPYYLEGGFRRVTPYHYTYNTNCKERWRGRELVDIFTSEFRDRKPEYYVRDSNGMQKFKIFNLTMNREALLKTAWCRSTVCAPIPTPRLRTARSSPTLPIATNPRSQVFP